VSREVHVPQLGIRPDGKSVFCYVPVLGWEPPEVVPESADYEYLGQLGRRHTRTVGYTIRVQFKLALRELMDSMGEVAGEVKVDLLYHPALLLAPPQQPLHHIWGTAPWQLAMTPYIVLDCIPEGYAGLENGDREPGRTIHMRGNAGITLYPNGLEL
jgi:hypothetical protein